MNMGKEKIEEMDEWSPFDEVDEERAVSKELERSGGRGWDDGAR